MKNRLLLTLISFIFSHNLMQAQIIWAEPAFPTPNQAVTIYFDATEGTGGLANCNCDVYLHTGVITSLSTGDSDWKHVVTSWGQANAAWKLDPVAGQPNVYSYQIQPTIKAYYNVTNPAEIIQKMAFVFRNGTGSLEGKGVGGADIFYEVQPENAGFTASLISPSSPSVFTQVGAVIDVKGISSQTATLSLSENGNLIYSTVGTELNYGLNVTSTGTHEILFNAYVNDTAEFNQTFTYVVPKATDVEALPTGMKAGINYLSSTEVLFALVAPNKQHVFLIGDFNDWELNTDYQLKRTPDDETWWIQIGGLTPGQFYAFQYVVDGTIRIGDPYSDLILDPNNDQYIPAANFPNIPPYPSGKTSGIVSLMKPGATAYNWQVNDFQRPVQENLVIYELLMRDFLHAQNYQTLKDTLDYLQRLGVTAIELMPSCEFDGNLGWGYNPTYHYALDKYYGTPEAFKAFVDEAHARGMAVISDVVFNHAHEKNPLCMLYWDAANFKPAANNPWLNTDPTHDYNVFFDFNHESQYTRDYVSQVLQHWINEYRIDGFRFDLSKGLTQNVGGPWHAGNYDASRIANLKVYADAIWDVEPETYVILEHFADNNEEKELSNYGMMLWTGGVHDQYKEAAMGYPSNLNAISYKFKGWNDPHTVGYMESHDEERMVYKNITFGNSSGDYNVKNTSTALARVELASTFFYTVPGPKMLWQFGEYGYDFSINRCTNGTINTNCRLDPKPIRWDYLNAADRIHVYNVVSRLTHLKNNFDVFQTADFQMNVTGTAKTIHLNDNDMNVTVLGNFAVTEQDINPQFQHTGWWYEYFTGDSINVSNASANINFLPGEYRLYTDVRTTPPAFWVDANETPAHDFTWTILPNPTRGEATVVVALDKGGQTELAVFDMNGKRLSTPFMGQLNAGIHELKLPDNLPAGLYFARLMVDGKIDTRKVVVQ